MKNAFLILYMVCLVAIVMAGAFATNRLQHVSRERALREAMLWGAGFVMYGAMDYFLVASAHGHLFDMV